LCGYGSSLSKISVPAPTLALYNLEKDPDFSDFQQFSDFQKYNTGTSNHFKILLNNYTDFDFAST
jgi:hypothetical protein